MSIPDINDTISVIVPLFNGRTFIREAVQSLLNEEHIEVEVIVVDDGSTDDSVRVLSGLPVTLIRNETNRGPATALNEGLKQASGSFVMFLDQDDRIPEGGLQWRWYWLNRHPTEQAIMGNVPTIIDERGRAYAHYRSTLEERYAQLKSRITFEFLKDGGWFPLRPLSSTLFRRPLIKQVGYFDESLKCTQDREYFYRLVQASPVTFINRPAVNVRWHKHNASFEWRFGHPQPTKRTVAETFLINRAYSIA